MGKGYVLDRVAADLSQGFTHPAIQRLGSLVAAHPHDLDLRRRLAAAHRRVGNRIQAGRWDYLTIGADSGDTSAFERAFPSAAARLRELGWPEVGHDATAYARARLAKLRQAAAAERRRLGGAGAAVATGARTAPRLWSVAVNRALARAGLSGRARRVATVATTIAAAGLVAVGAATVVQWTLQ
jgi:hypothetical protein